MRNFTSVRAQEIPPSGIRKFFDLVLTMEDVITLGVGEPDFRTPWNICESSIYSIEQGVTSYTSNKGLQTLRDALSRYLAQHYNLNYSSDHEILITTGVSEALDIAVRAIVDPGDEVEEGGLAAAAGAHEGVVAAGWDVQVDALEHRNLQRLAVVALRHASQADDRLPVHRSFTLTLVPGSSLVSESSTSRLVPGSRPVTS